MNQRSGHHHPHRLGVLLASLTLTCLTAAACGTTNPPTGHSESSSSPAEHSTAAPDFKVAYAAGYKAGKDIYDAGGKGAAVREVVGGGCAHRALEADDAGDMDRGAWVQGCHDGVSNNPKRPPAHAVSRREANGRLLADFKAWARDGGEANAARHVTKVSTVDLVDPDYDVELRTDSNKAGAEALAAAFADWWDGDDGDGVARNLIVLDAHDQRLAVKRL